MCLAVPMQVVAIDGTMARCQAKGVERDVSLFLLLDQTVAPGDFVLVRAGYAIQTIEPMAARSTLELFDQMLAHEDATPDA